jgi:hypothetical protein
MAEFSATFVVKVPAEKLTIFTAMEITVVVMATTSSLPAALRNEPVSHFNFSSSI